MYPWSSSSYFFHLVGVLASVKQLRKCASDTVMWALQGETKVEDMVEALSHPLVSHDILLGYILIAISYL